MKKVFPLVGVLCKNKVSGEESIVHRADIVSGPFIRFYTLDSKITNKQMNDWVFAWVDSDDEEETQWLCITDWIKKYETTHRLVGSLAIRQGSGLNMERVKVVSINEYTNSFTHLRNGISVNCDISQFRFSFKNSYGWQLFSSLNEEVLKNER